jgi:hypothetical protein
MIAQTVGASAPRVPRALQRKDGVRSVFVEEAGKWVIFPGEAPNLLSSNARHPVCRNGSWIKVSQIRTLAVERIGRRLSRAPDEEVARVLEGRLTDPFVLHGQADGPRSNDRLQPSLRN